MALNALLESLDDIPEAIRSEYREVDVPNLGKRFALDISGIDAHPSVINLKSAFERLKTDKKKLSTELTETREKLAAVPADFDVAEWEALKAAADGDGGDDKHKETKDGLVRARKQLEQQIESLKAKHEGELRLKDKTIEDKDVVIRRLLVDDGLTKALIEAQVDPKFLKATKAMLAPAVKVMDDDGEYVAVIETDIDPEMPVAKYVKEIWAASDDGKAFITKPAGTGAGGGGGQKTSEANPWLKDKINLTEQGRIIKSDPAKAERLMREAGLGPTQVDSFLNRSTRAA